jgi:hypothetical protein
MASYAELYNLATEDAALAQKIAAACAIAATAIWSEDGGTNNHANRLIWARQVFANPVSQSSRMLWVVLGANSSATKAQIAGASDATIQTAVNAAVDLFADGSE